MRIVHLILAIAQPQIQEQIVKVVVATLQERVSERVVEQIVAVLVLRFMEEIVEMFFSLCIQRLDRRCQKVRFVFGLTALSFFDEPLVQAMESGTCCSRPVLKLSNG